MFLIKAMQASSVTEQASNLINPVTKCDREN
jgi:hypothetical protein